MGNLPSAHGLSVQQSSHSAQAQTFVQQQGVIQESVRESKMSRGFEDPLNDLEAIVRSGISRGQAMNICRNQRRDCTSVARNQIARDRLERRTSSRPSSNSFSFSDRVRNRNRHHRYRVRAPVSSSVYRRRIIGKRQADQDDYADEVELIEADFANGDSNDADKHETDNHHMSGIEMRRQCREDFLTCRSNIQEAFRRSK